MRLKNQGYFMKFSEENDEEGSEFNAQISTKQSNSKSQKSFLFEGLENALYLVRMSKAF